VLFVNLRLAEGSRFFVTAKAEMMNTLVMPHLFAVNPLNLRNTLPNMLLEIHASGNHF